MKLSLILVTLFTTFNFSFGQHNMMLASCSNDEVGKCTGSSYCTACTNCSRCGHCGSGGSCGVCSTSYRPTKKKRTSTNYSEPSSRKSSNSYSSKSKPYNLADDTSSKYYLKTLIVKIDALNLRSGPGVSYAILEKLKKDQELIFQAMIGNWVKVKSSKNIGFVHYKYILVSDR